MQIQVHFERTEPLIESADPRKKDAPVRLTSDQELSILSLISREEVRAILKTYGFGVNETIANATALKTMANFEWRMLQRLSGLGTVTGMMFTGWGTLFTCIGIASRDISIAGGGLGMAAAGAILAWLSWKFAQFAELKRHKIIARDK